MKPQVCVWQAWSATRRKAARETRRQDGSLAQVTRARAGPTCIGGAPLPSPRRRECTIPQGSSGTGLAQATVDAGGGAVQDTIGSLLGTRAGVTVVRARPVACSMGTSEELEPLETRRARQLALPADAAPLPWDGPSQRVVNCRSGAFARVRVRQIPRACRALERRPAQSGVAGSGATRSAYPGWRRT